MNLSEHFTLAEMTVSETAARKGINNVPGDYETANLRALCKNVLEPIRAHFARPVIVTSGYRSPRLNKAIGGSATSQHCYGQAADFTVPGVGNLDLCKWIERHLDYDQVIYEFGEAGWVHVSYAPAMRKMELSAKRVKGKTVYLPGLVA